MTTSEKNQYQYLQYKFITDKELSEDEQKLFNELQEKFIKNQEYQIRLSKAIEEQRHKQEVFEKIKPLCEFKSTFVKKCQSRQTGEKDVFYDIELVKWPSVQVYDTETYKLLNKYNKIRGRSQWLSNYACYREDIIMNNYICYYFLPAINAAYEDYVRDNFYGKDGEYQGEKVKNFQIDWFDEVFIADEKIPTTFQKQYKEQRKHYDKLIEWKGGESESWERAWVDYVERYDIHRYVYDCKDMIMHPESYSHIKNIPEYIKEAEKILGRKLLNH